jgi:hypothetical protein
LAYFVIERDGTQIAQVPQKSNNPFGRPVFQGLQYSDTPPLPLTQMLYRDASFLSDAAPTDAQKITVHSVNTVGRASAKTSVTIQPVTKPSSMP